MVRRIDPLTVQMKKADVRKTEPAFEFTEWQRSLDRGDSDLQVLLG